MANVFSNIGDWVNERAPGMMPMYRAHMTEYYAPKNFNLWYYFGSLALLVLVNQIVTGIFLTMNYNPSAAGAFDSVQYIMRDVEWGWLIRYMHSTGASLFFIVVFLHMFRGIIYGSFKRPRELVWLLGMLIFLVLMAEAFMGYVLPWGNMSFWGAKVIISLFGTIPVIGTHLVEWIMGDFLPGDATLNRFFAPLPVFTFGIWFHPCVLRRPEHHDHVATVDRRLLLDLAELLDVLCETVEKHPATLRVKVLPPPEHDRDLDLRPLVQEADDVALLRLVIVIADLRSELDLLDVDRRLVLPCLLRPLLLLVAPFSEVHDARHGRVGLLGHLHEVEVLRVRVLERLLRVLDPDLLPVLTDEPDPRHADLLVDPFLLDDGTRPVLGTTPRSQRQFTKPSRSSSFC